MSGLMEYDDEDEEEAMFEQYGHIDDHYDENNFSDDNDLEEEIFHGEDIINELVQKNIDGLNTQNVYNLNTWFILTDIPNTKGEIACKLVLPNPKVIGYEITIEICEYLLEELDRLSRSNKFVHITAVRAISNSMFILQNLLDSLLKKIELK